MLIKEKLKHSKFSDSQRIVVDYMLKAGPKIRNKTVRQIAKETYTSSATLIRIAHKLDFTGWEELKRAFIEEQDYLSSHFQNVNANVPFEKDDSSMTIANRIAVLEKEAIDDTLALIDWGAIEQAAAIVDDCPVVNIVAMNNTIAQAEEFMYKMGRIQKRVIVQPPSGEGLYNGTILDPASCMIVISYTGETSNFIRWIRFAKESHVPVIAITSLGDNTISKLADLTLRICTREKLYSKISWYASEASISYLLNVLYSLVFARHYDQNFAAKVERSKKIEKGRKSSISIINEEKP
ncbi:MurR/RpiR family transcriptional regulator [Dubosiella muris]|uniref:MurR/RpiR family transcriptional regulator n=1 Tax=Dubosiella muris TaxID=3038133 RepID=A0AC61R9M4_9FIRM|nr:MurR/RpiR family transcriptional regulator [Dubosiella muris]TGY66757.1 MurR/RpiR family transcriptional regulator [Dubosiella muris]